MTESSSGFDLDDLWGSLLSRQPVLVRTAYLSLPDHERQFVINHLQRMAEEPGWHPEQVISAQAALRAIQDETTGSV